MKFWRFLRNTNWIPFLVFSSKKHHPWTRFIVVFMALMAKIWTFHIFTIKIWVSWWQRYELFISLPSRFVFLDGVDMNFHITTIKILISWWCWYEISHLYHQDMFLDGVDMKFHISTIKICFLMVLIWTFISLPSRYVSWWCWYEISHLYHQEHLLMVLIWTFHISTIKNTSWWQSYELFIALPSRFKHWIMFKGDDFIQNGAGNIAGLLSPGSLWLYMNRLVEYQSNFS